MRTNGWHHRRPDSAFSDGPRAPPLPPSRIVLDLLDDDSIDSREDARARLPGTYFSGLSRGGGAELWAPPGVEHSGSRSRAAPSKSGPPRRRRERGSRFDRSHGPSDDYFSERGLPRGADRGAGVVRWRWWTGPVRTTHVPDSAGNHKKRGQDHPAPIPGPSLGGGRGPRRHRGGRRAALAPCRANGRRGDNPLLARVDGPIVSGHHHFGRGQSFPTPDDFGAMGQPPIPSRAARLPGCGVSSAEAGRSSTLHRWIATSRHLSHGEPRRRGPEPAGSLDPDNRLLHRIARAPARGGDHPRRPCWRSPGGSTRGMEGTECACRTSRSFMEGRGPTEAVGSLSTATVGGSPLQSACAGTSSRPAFPRLRTIRCRSPPRGRRGPCPNVSRSGRSLSSTTPSFIQEARRWAERVLGEGADDPGPIAIRRL